LGEGKEAVMEMDKMLWPVTIMRTRYGGVYEGGEWVAFNADPWSRWYGKSDGLPMEAFADDITCGDWWASDAAALVGRGATPDEALKDLHRRIAERGGNGG
jgi:hypothetical protein